MVVVGPAIVVVVAAVVDVDDTVEVEELAVVDAPDPLTVLESAPPPPQAVSNIPAVESAQSNIALEIFAIILFPNLNYFCETIFYIFATKYSIGKIFLEKILL